MPSSSRVVKHTRCPKCAELGRDNHKDNLAVYEDGHVFCFACRYHLPAVLSVERMKRSLDSSVHESCSHEYNERFLRKTTILPTKAKEWLEKYGINNKEVIDNNLFYDLDSELLVFPIWRDGVVVAYNARNFEDNPKSKYISKGKIHTYPVLLNTPHDIHVCVEDFVSAIKVSRQFGASPLFGTKLHRNIFDEIPAAYVILWLDFDKADDSLKQTATLRQTFDNVFTLISKRDPKEYTDKEINALVHNCINRNVN